jgi:hypothetical protein
MWQQGWYLHLQAISARKKLLTTLPLNTIERYKEKKWGFIKQYWARNYKKFIG